ncbi:(deoxy)nucleoside triphosphate pyrophosphohydrolase [Cnuibacter physcomitrellae]|uniref:(deoxy)nucleoside triphosphate pyrophosphohydrolase n=1 Tax=Cnuibacter physcomitrellae TaxID=1619308 RepID=UPI002175E212|nr:(deoxy)nucleoside triphosphate pyrophosphohydrolase [Cnuibacter physcomitrellae]MCS5495624.1 (deoxy)nucleoside triphosphate pyrophosphohydrolase [Cnuibacter physcomitrellae]
MKSVVVVAGVFVAGDRVLACRRKQGKAAEGKWEFPGGKVEPREDPRAALTRELEEELGANVVVGDLLDRSSTPVGEAIIDLSCYEVTLSGAEPTGSTDHDLLQWVSPDQASTLEWAEPDLPMVARLQALIASRSAQ